MVGGVEVFAVPAAVTVVRKKYVGGGRDLGEGEGEQGKGGEGRAEGGKVKGKEEGIAG